MLTLQSIAGPRDSEATLLNFDPDSSTWIVSDLKSKLDLHRKMLSQRDFLPGESILRASELWKIFLTRLRPDLQIVSREFILALIGQELSRLNIEWARSPGATRSAYDYLSQLMPILAHPSGEDIMSQWLNENPASQSRWGRWYDLSLQLWRGFLAEGFVAPPWVSGVLVNEQGLSEVWTRPLIVDLGAELTQVEADLLVLASQHLDVTVLMPEPTWRGEYAKALVAYELFERKGAIIRKLAAPDSKGTGPSHDTLRFPATNYRRVTTMIAEVKEATAQLRRWLDGPDAVAPHEVAIVAPDIESYWPSLALYLKQEGIPFQKNQVRRLHSFPDVARWLAVLRLRSGAFSEADLELASFDVDERVPKLISYDRFRTLYSIIYEREDMHRSDVVAKNFALEITASDEVPRDEFVAWTIRQLPESIDFTRVEPILKRLLAESPQGLKLSFGRWRSYLEELASRIENLIVEGDPSGVSVIGLSSAEHSPALRMIIMGLTESALKSKGGTAILASDLSDLAYRYGFHLSSEDQAKLEFEARWIIEGSRRELVLTVPETDFGGGVQAASWLWVRGAKAAGVLDQLTIPGSTRWDELQKSGLEKIATERLWPSVLHDQVKCALDEDLGLKAIGPFAEKTVRSLSPSGIEDYLRCPFIFAAKRLFSLVDVSEIDLEVDPTRRGSLIHAMFELLTVEPMRFDRTKIEYEHVVDEARAKSKIELADERLWPALRARHVDLAIRFVSFERDYRLQFPQTNTVQRELKIFGSIDAETGEINKYQRPSSLGFSGAIDRIDADQNGKLAIYDYKSSVNSVSHHGQWLKKNQVQLLLYSMAIEAGLSESLSGSEVVSATYYSAKPLNREYGFRLEGVEQSLYDSGDRRKRNRMTLEEKGRLYASGRELVRQVVNGVLAGDFAPNPREPAECKKCQWSSICRAPHLSR